MSVPQEIKRPPEEVQLMEFKSTFILLVKGEIRYSILSPSPGGRKSDYARQINKSLFTFFSMHCLWVESGGNLTDMFLKLHLDVVCRKCIKKFFMIYSVILHIAL